MKLRRYSLLRAYGQCFFLLSTTNNPCSFTSHIPNTRYNKTRNNQSYCRWILCVYKIQTVNYLIFHLQESIILYVLDFIFYILLSCNAPFLQIHKMLPSSMHHNNIINILSYKNLKKYRSVGTSLVVCFVFLYLIRK